MNSIVHWLNTPKNEGRDEGFERSFRVSAAATQPGPDAANVRILRHLMNRKLRPFETDLPCDGYPTGSTPHRSGGLMHIVPFLLFAISVGGSSTPESAALGDSAAGGDPQRVGILSIAVHDVGDRRRSCIGSRSPTNHKAVKRRAGATRTSAILCAICGVSVRLGWRQAREWLCVSVAGRCLQQLV
jgi:hypothetical protein